jgi:myo-inositol-1(or 4)-monophosphatase
MNKLSFPVFTDFVEKITTETSLFINKCFDSNIVNKRKKCDGTIVTDVDLNTERYIREQIELSYPSHGILGEELVNKERSTECVWIIDPIDGTFNFARGVPLFGTLIGYLYDESPAYGCMRLPKLGNELLVGDNDTCLLNGRNTKCSSFVSWDEALILTTDEKSIAESSIASNWQILKKREAQFRTWGDCYGYYLLCTGKADAMLDIDLKPYDILPLIPILKGAGLSIVDFSTKRDFTSIVACKPEIEEEFVQLFIT